MQIEDLCLQMKQRTDRYIDQCDKLYAYLVEPFILLRKENPEIDNYDDLIQPPEPSFLQNQLQEVDEPLPQELFDL